MIFSFGVFNKRRVNVYQPDINNITPQCVLLYLCDFHLLQFNNLFINAQLRNLSKFVDHARADSNI